MQTAYRRYLQHHFTLRTACNYRTEHKPLVLACSYSRCYESNQLHGAVYFRTSAKFIIEFARSPHLSHSSQMNPVHKVTSIFHCWRRYTNISQNFRSCGTFTNMLRQRVFSFRPTHKLEDHAFSAVCNRLIYIFAVTTHIQKPSPPPATSKRAMP